LVELGISELIQRRHPKVPAFEGVKGISVIELIRSRKPIALINECEIEIVVEAANVAD